jgi:hypothetical protein
MREWVEANDKGKEYNPINLNVFLISISDFLFIQKICSIIFI